MGRWNGSILLPSRLQCSPFEAQPTACRLQIQNGVRSFVAQAIQGYPDRSRGSEASDPPLEVFYPMTIEAEFDQEMASLFRRTGEATGDYWPYRFNQSVRTNGGLTVAKRLLLPGSVSEGFGRLVKSRRADLSVEFIASSERFADLFTPEELATARQRLSELPPTAFPTASPDGEIWPDEISPGADYEEGGVQQVLVNRYERDPKARGACIQRHGARCAVCEFDFVQRYGKVGEGYIHVHHKRPLGTLKATYKPDPIQDLVPVCPNCHAMLHRQNPPYDIPQLQAMLR